MAGNFLSHSVNLVSLLACINVIGVSAGQERCVFVQQGLATVTQKVILSEESDASLIAWPPVKYPFLCCIMRDAQTSLSFLVENLVKLMNVKTRQLNSFAEFWIPASGRRAQPGAGRAEMHTHNETWE